MTPWARSRKLSSGRPRARGWRRSCSANCRSPPSARMALLLHQKASRASSTLLSSSPTFLFRDRLMRLTWSGRMFRSRGSTFPTKSDKFECKHGSAPTHLSATGYSPGLSTSVSLNSGSFKLSASLESKSSKNLFRASGSVEQKINGAKQWSDFSENKRSSGAKILKKSKI